MHHAIEETFADKQARAGQLEAVLELTASNPQATTILHPFQARSTYKLCQPARLRSIFEPVTKPQKGKSQLFPPQLSSPTDCSPHENPMPPLISPTTSTCTEA